MTQPHHTLILGGARSGKSQRALTLAGPYINKVFIATGQAFDDEMAARIERHKDERGPEWALLECPLDLCSVLTQNDQAERVMLIDCVTLWLSNLMMAERDINAEITQLCQHLSRLRASVIFVSNEVGLGLVPETAMGRAFRDHQGRANQALAQVCDRVEFIAAGLPLTLKPQA